MIFDYGVPQNFLESMISHFQYKYYQGLGNTHGNFQAIVYMNFKDHLKFYFSSNLFCSFNYEATSDYFHMFILLFDMTQLQYQFRWTYLRMQLLRWEVVRTAFAFMEYTSTTGWIATLAVL